MTSLWYQLILSMRPDSRICRLSKQYDVKYKFVYDGSVLSNHWINYSQYWMANRRDIKNNAWVTVNNDFLVTSEEIRRWFSRVTKSRVKILAESPHEWQKIVIHGNECIILFLTRYCMSWTHKSAKNYHWALISPLLLRAAFSDRALWRHHNWSVTSCEREILILWRHICLLSLHAQVDAKAIFTSE